ncbi:hypothetical protein N865_01265 [Intrasporangium oryzae NRRL B-24470]|uniref:DUF2130 domain-containing protein n=1 Tax=Intrasporangium oryzae NRRL B-24470 TaxID=1386089 RepID=W9G474_9MICO|nr:DUF2130 domain-containing protein [Intrasporangium oryzae]EWS99577.1 hypothetical protein N865_01265 [Intrasporangium oryzae NRRL B-24470]
MSTITATSARAKAPLQICPFCGQSLDKGAAARLATALKEAKHERDAEVQHLVDQGVIDAKATLLAERDRRLALMRQEHKEALSRLQEQARTEEHERDVAQARAKAIEEELRQERQNRNAAVLEEVTKAEEVMRRQLKEEYEDQAAKQEASRDQLRRIIDRLKAEKDQLRQELEEVRPQVRGDMDEDKLVSVLSRAFEGDDIQRNAARRGADVLHTVNYGVGGGQKQAGLIVYECKDTKNWLNDFITQARTSRDLHHAQYAVLVTHAFPSKESRPLFVRDNVIVVEPDRDRVVAVASLLRSLAIEIARAQSRTTDRSAATQLFDYVKSADFHHAVQFVYDARKRLESLLQKEQRSHQKDWAAREKLYRDFAERVLQVESHIGAIIQGDSTAST